MSLNLISSPFTTQPLTIPNNNDQNLPSSSIMAITCFLHSLPLKVQNPIFLMSDIFLTLLNCLLRVIWVYMIFLDTSYIMMSSGIILFVDNNLWVMLDLLFAMWKGQDSGLFFFKDLLIFSKAEEMSFFTLILFSLLLFYINNIMLQLANCPECLVQDEPHSNRDSGSTTGTEEDSLSPCCPLVVRNLSNSNYDPRLEIFRISKTAGEISQKLIEKAIRWIQITGYTKKLSFQTVVLAIALFYASLTQISISKKNLESTSTEFSISVCACLLLASKMSSRNQLSLSEITGLIQKYEAPGNIMAIEKSILEAFDFNIHFNFPLFDKMGQLKCEIQQHKVQFLTQVLLIKDASILYDLQKVQQVLEMSLLTRVGDGKLNAKINKIIKKCNCEDLVKKYQSMFKVDEFIKETPLTYDFL